jgi:hypothetical protein
VSRSRIDCFRLDRLRNIGRIRNSRTRGRPGWGGTRCRCIAWSSGSRLGSMADRRGSAAFVLSTLPVRSLNPFVTLRTPCSRSTSPVDGTERLPSACPDALPSRAVPLVRKARPCQRAGVSVLRRGGPCFASSRPASSEACGT